ncbi:hypothetical protein [Rhodococcus erythropolis]|uniref:Uncharacterized protein n=1 Tax=Rhodococcus erythropolis (strain PR4 / NBRC 100887) TaxID=234621 RepID=C0ZWP0_RHOE4|nr:hypothetical protein [Rhodococcus erythropolis]BAH32775.1 hypothetical protein RER_20670 [Rhodococcus erythropolis PR4]
MTNTTSDLTDIYSEDIRVEFFDDKQDGKEILFTEDDRRPILSYRWDRDYEELAEGESRRSGQWVLFYDPDNGGMYETDVRHIDPSSVNDVLKAARSHLRDLAAHQG